MEEFNRKDHWENIYSTKKLTEVSWYQPTPETSLDLIDQTNIGKDGKIIDVGGGDSFLVDHLIDLGYNNITVLDISEKAIDRAKERLGDKAQKVNWIVADAANFTPTTQYDIWHDRAAFHFLTHENEIENYKSALYSGLNEGGHFIVGTFSDSGPLKCSGIEIKQYNKQDMIHSFGKQMQMISCFTTNHDTPFDSIQNFIFCHFQKRSMAQENPEPLKTT